MAKLFLLLLIHDININLFTYLCLPYYCLLPRLLHFLVALLLCNLIPHIQSIPSTFYSHLQIHHFTCRFGSFHTQFTSLFSMVWASFFKNTINLTNRFQVSLGIILAWTFIINIICLLTNLCPLIPSDIIYPLFLFLFFLLFFSLLLSIKQIVNIFLVRNNHTSFIILFPSVNSCLSFGLKLYIMRGLSLTQRCCSFKGIIFSCVFCTVDLLHLWLLSWSKIIFLVVMGDWVDIFFLKIIFLNPVNFGTLAAHVLRSK